MLLGSGAAAARMRSRHPAAHPVHHRLPLGPKPRPQQQQQQHKPDGRDAHLAPTPRPPPPQIPALRPVEYSRISKRQKKVTRAYGGSRCANCVRMRCAAAPKPRPPRAGRTRLPGRWARHAPRLVWSSHAAALRQRDARARTHAWPACMRADALTLRFWLRRIVRAFLIEEQKIVKKVLKSQAVGAK